MAYKVVKWRKGHPYLYEQETYREGGKVKTRCRYLGKIDNMTKKTTKYDVQDALFDHEHGVLKNKLGIIDANKLGVIEGRCLLNAYKQTSSLYDKNHKFTENDVKDLHKLFLGDVFDWAGKYRDVDISSPGIRYCHAAYLPQNMADFSKRLARLTPFTPDLTKEEIVKRLAEIHGELIIIHPFRDGNGRTTRLLCDLLLLQSGRMILDTDKFYTKKFLGKYHKAIQKLWHSGDYTDLEVLLDSLMQ